MAEKKVITLFCLFLKNRNHNNIIVSEKVNNKFLMFLNSYLLFKYPWCHTYAFHTYIHIICPRKYSVFRILLNAFLWCYLMRSFWPFISWKKKLVDLNAWSGLGLIIFWLTFNYFISRINHENHMFYFPTVSH